MRKRNRISARVCCMNAAGLERKCDIKAYMGKVERVTGIGS